MARFSVARLDSRCLAAMALAALGVPLLALCAILAPPRQIGVGAENDQRSLRGFYAPIVGERVTYRWTSPDAELRLHGWSHTSARLRLQLDGGSGAAPRRLTLLRADNGTPLATLLVSSGWSSYVVDLPPQAFGLTPVLGPARLALRAERYRPGPNGEEFGFKVDWVHIEPLGRSWTIVLLRSVLLVWPIALLALGLGQMERHASARRPWLAHASRPLPWLTLVALGIGLARFPLVTGWLLPPAPVICGLLTLLVAWRPLSRMAAAGASRLQACTSPALRSLALIAALATLGLLFARAPLRWALPLAFLAVVLALLLSTPTAAEGTPAEGGVTERPSRRTLLALALIVLTVSFGLRFYRLTELPAGLWRDEARHGLAALHIIEDPTYRPVFVPAADIPAGGIYAFVPAFLLFGIRTWTMRVVTALAGALTVIPLAFVARRLTRRWDTALLAAGLLAASAWHLTISRLSFMSVFQPLLELSALAILGHALDACRGRTTRTLWLLAGGGLLGVALYTYHTGRLAFPIGIAFVLCLSAQEQRLRRGLAALLPALAAFALLVTPLLWYTARQPQEANARMAQVFLFAPAALDGEAPLSALDASLGRHLLMLHVRGDSIGRHNLPGQPEMDPILGLGFLAGLLWLGQRPRSPVSLFLLGACALGLLPSLLSVDGPRATRAFELLPYACIVAATGWTRLLRTASPRTTNPAAPLALLMLTTALLGSWSYFIAQPRDPAVWRAFYTVETRIGEYLRTVANHEGAAALQTVYVPASLAREEVTQYLSHALRFGILDEEALTLHPRPKGAFRLLLRDPQVPPALVTAIAALGHRYRQTTAGPLLPDGTTPAFWILHFD